jgi:hypothetical protein
MRGYLRLMSRERELDRAGRRPPGARDPLTAKGVCRARSPPDARPAVSRDLTTPSPVGRQESHVPHRMLRSPRGWQSSVEKAVAFTLLAALLGLHLHNCVRRADGRSPRGWQWTLAAQAVLTVVGMIWFASTWYGNSGFLAAAVLLLVRPRSLGWAGFGLVLVTQFFSALPVRPTVAEALYLVIGHTAFVGIALYGVARLADLVADLRDTRTRLADAEVARERVAFAERLRERIGTSLDQVVRHSEAVLGAAEPEAARQRLNQSLDTARAALNEARSVARSHRASVPSWGPSPTT